MQVLFTVNNGLLICSLILLLADSYRAYFLEAKPARQRRTVLGLTISTLLTLCVVGIAIVDFIHPYPRHYFTFLIFEISLALWMTSSLWRIKHVQKNDNHLLLRLGNIIGSIAMLLFIGLFITGFITGKLH